MDRKICHDKTDDSYKICCAYIKAAIMGSGSLCLVSERAKSNNSSDLNLVFTRMITPTRMGSAESLQSL